MNTPSTIEVKIEKTADALIVRLNGEAGVRSADEMERGLRPVMASQPGLVIIDMSALSFVSSLGLGMLVELHRGIMRNGGKARFAGSQPQVRDVIVKCQLDSVLRLYANVNDALIDRTNNA